MESVDYLKAFETREAAEAHARNVVGVTAILSLWREDGTGLHAVYGENELPLFHTALYPVTKEKP